MGEEFAALDWPSAATWGVFALNAVVTLAAQSSGHARTAFHRWRLDRRLARDPFILREELREYELAIGDDPEPLDLVKVARNALLVGVLTAVPAWLAERHLEHWWHYAMFAFVLFGILTGVWRGFNDPPEMHPETGMPPIDVPREAWLGLAGGIGVVVLILLFIAALV